MTDSSQQSDTAPAEADLSGRNVGNFRLLRRLGRGAMAEVYLAEQSLLRRRVAVKILKPELAEDQTYLKRFEREAQAAASLVHANIVQIHEVGHVDRLHYIAQEYIQGQNLREWIARNGPPDLPHALSIMRQVAAALAKAAEQGVVHRDVKPENIMLTPSGEVKVADFGLARIAREGEAIDLTRIGITLGTPLYMSPEQVEGKPLDHRSDLYSFGVTCYHMLSGSPPFTGETALGVAVQHLKKQPQPLENLRPDLPAPLCRLVHKMLGKEPEHRCQSALEVLRELRRLHVEHFGDNWPEDLPGWETTGVELPSDERRQLTEQLGGLMKTAALRSPGYRVRLLFVAGLAASFLLGSSIAWLTREEFLLAGAENLPPTIADKGTPLGQYLYASTRNDEAGWESVIEYYEGTTFARHAEQQLARIYLLEKRDYDRASGIFKKFALLDEEEYPSLRAFGLAGQFVVLALREEADYAEMANILGEEAIRDNLVDPDMQRLLRFAVSKYKSELQKRTNRNLEELIQQLAPEEPPDED
ncbi:MAG: serine/threonine-protein kinase [Planctomycetota bacterium]|jgi:serine/threonine-protein kinase